MDTMQALFNPKLSTCYDNFVHDIQYTLDIAIFLG